MSRTGQGQISCLRHNDTHDQLACLNDFKARLYLPVTIFLALLIIVGTLGNVTVCVVYWRRSSRVSSHYFILSLAILDLVTCLVGMPTEIADLVLPYTFESPVACKVLRFLHSSTIIASSTILIEVAFDRYYRICQLGRQFTAAKARLLCIGALVLGIVCSWPSCILFGRKTVAIDLGGHVLHGTDCSTDDSMRGTIYPTIYYLFLFSLFGLTLAFFSVLYAKIGLRIMGQNRLRAGGSGTSSSCNSTSSRKSLFKTREEKTAETSNSELSSEHEAENFTDRFPPSSISSGSSGPVPPRPQIGSTSSASANDDPFDDESPTTKGGPVYTIPTSKWIHHPWNSSCCKATAGGALSNLTSNGSGVLQSSNHSARSSIHTENATVNDMPEIATKRYGTTNNGVESCKQPQHTLCKDVDNDCCMNNAYNNFCSSCCCCNCGRSCNVGDEDGVHSCKQHRYNSHYNLNSHCHHHQHQNPKKLAKSRRLRYTGNHSNGRACSRQLRVGKTTTVLFAVTLAYILSFLPYLTVMVMRSVVRGLEESLSPMGELVYKLCVKSFFINNAINPLIYSFLNQAFRKDAKDAFSKLFRRRRGLQSGHFA